MNNRTNTARIATGFIQASPSTPIHAFFTVTHGRSTYRVTACTGRTLSKPRPFGLFDTDTIFAGTEGVCKTCRDGIATGRIVTNGAGK